jgi:hypothetical protein
MTHTVVRRVTLGLCGVFLLAAWIFAWIANRPPTGSSSGSSVAPVRAADPSAAALFATKCGSCHTQAELLRVIRTAPDRAAKLDELESFLTMHASATGAEDRVVLSYLSDLATP